MQPFSEQIDNAAELLSTLTLSILCLFLVATPASTISTARAGGLSAMCLLVAFVFAARIVHARYVQYRTEKAGKHQPTAGSEADAPPSSELLPTTVSPSAVSSVNEPAGRYALLS